ncbi:MAG: LamG-like jellyroll fold domain-containing protein, partial [Candidatus Aenigmatarchaeota archaeon]
MTNMDLQLYGENVSLGKNLTLEGRLRYNNTGLGNQTLTFYLNNTEVGSSYTNSSGWCIVELNSSILTTDTYFARVSFSGNESFNLTKVNEKVPIEILPRIEQKKAIVGEPVRWKKVVKKRNELDKSKEINVSFKLPADAREVSVRRRNIESRRVSNENESKVVSAYGEVHQFSTGSLRTRRIKEKEPIEDRIKKKMGGIELQEVVLQDRIEPDRTTEYEVEFQTSAPEKVEKRSWDRKQVTIYSNSSYHYYNVTASASLPEMENKPSIYRLVRKDVENSKTDNVVDELSANRSNSTNDNLNSSENSESNGLSYKRIDITNNPLYNVTYLDTNNDSLYDRIVWNVPELSEDTYEITLDILNIQSYPSMEGNWTVEFNTTGISNLTITPVNNTTWSRNSENSSLYDLKFEALTCGNESVDYEWIGGNNTSSVFVENYSCNGTGMEFSKVLTGGHHYLNFTFGNESEIAKNLVTLHWSQYTDTNFSSGDFSNTETLNTGGDAFVRLQSSGSSGTWSNTKNLGEMMNIVGIDVWNTQSSCSMDVTVEEVNEGGSVTKTLSGGSPDSWSSLGLQDSEVKITVTFGSTCTDQEVVDGIELDVEGSNTCDVDDMDVEIRTPDNSSTTGWLPTSYSSVTGTCGSDPDTTETWTNNYFYCPQDGSYDVRTRAYTEEQEANNTFSWETSDFFADQYSCSGPRGLAATGQDGEPLNSELGTMELTWTDNTSNEAGFSIERSKMPTSFSEIGNASGDTTGYNDSNLEDNMAYYYRTRAFGNGTYSTYSNMAAGTTEDRTGPTSSNLTVSADNSNNEVDLSWEWSQDEIMPDVSNDGLVGRWNFETGSGTIAEDNSGNGNSGTLEGDPQWTSGIQGDYGLEFDGSDDYVKVPDDDSLDLSTYSAFTISCWAYPTNLDTDRDCVAKGPGDKGIELRYDNGNDNWVFDLHDDGGWKYAWHNDISPSLNSWVHLLGVYDDGEIKIYVNGDKGETTSVGPIQDVTNYDLQLSNWGTGSRYWSGSIDEVRIYDRALSKEEIRKMSLVGQWHFDEGSGEKAFDATSHGNNGLLKDSNHSNSDGNTLPTWTDGVYDKALDFDGIDDYLQINNSESLNITDEITLEVWVKDPPIKDLNQNTERTVEEPNIEVNEKSSSEGKVVSVSSGKDSHTYNVSTSTTIPDTVKKPSIYKVVNGEKIDITKDPRYSVNYLDTNNNGKYDKVTWVVPKLSEKTFLVDIDIINVQSYPTVGGNWTVRFNTTGTADLRITPINGTNWEDSRSNGNSIDLEFLEVICDNKSLDYRWMENRDGSNTVLIENYSCDYECKEVSKVYTEGKHHLMFEFGNDSDVAKNKAFERTSRADWKNGTLYHTEADSSPGDLKLGSKNSSDDSLVGYWRFDSSSGDVKDYSGNDNNGTTHGGVTRGVDGIRNSTAFEFDGSDDYVNISESEELKIDKYQGISFWFKGEALIGDNEGYQTFEVATNGSRFCYCIEEDDGTDHNICADPISCKDSWCHASLVYDGRGSELYINGIKKSSDSFSADISSDSLDFDVGFASSSWVASDSIFGNVDVYASGVLDELMIYSRSLGLSEIKDLYSPSPGYYTTEFL